MKTLYNAAGEAKTMDFVDAREHLETGRWFEETPETNQGVIEPVDAAIEPAKRGKKAKVQE